MADPVIEPTPDEEKEPETLGELVESIIGKAVPAAIADARKAWAKDLADLLDVGADTSSVDDPANPPPAPTVDPPVVVDPTTPAPTGVRSRKFSLL